MWTISIFDVFGRNWDFGLDPRTRIPDCPLFNFCKSDSLGLLGDRLGVINLYLDLWLELDLSMALRIVRLMPPSDLMWSNHGSSISMSDWSLSIRVRG